jgi:integrase
VTNPRQLPNGRWEARIREAGRDSRRLSRTFDRKTDADTWLQDKRRAKQLGKPLTVEHVTLEKFMEDYWRLHAVPNLRTSTRESYLSLWAVHVQPRLGSRDLRQITPKVITRFRNDLEHAGVGAATVVKAMALVQSILAFAVTEERVEFNAASSVRKPRYTRAREPHIFLPAAVETIREHLDERSATLVALLAYSGARPEEVLRLRWRDVGTEALAFDDTKRRRLRHTPLLAPLADDLRAFRLSSGAGRRPNAPVISTDRGEPWGTEHWRNWRRRYWGHYDRDVKGRRFWTGGQRGGFREAAAPEGTRPRDLRSSYITVQLYAGEPLSTVARWAGTSVAMIDKHYASTIANWDGVRVPAETQIRRARERRRSA